jgi:hypothetical protein
VRGSSVTQGAIASVPTTSQPPPWGTQVIHHLTQSVLDLAHVAAFGVMKDTRLASNAGVPPITTARIARKSTSCSQLETMESRLDNLVRLLARLTLGGSPITPPTNSNERALLRSLMREFSNDNTKSGNRKCLFRIVLDSCLTDAADVDENDSDVSTIPTHKYIWSRQAIAITSVLVRMPAVWLSNALGHVSTRKEQQHLEILNDTAHSLWHTYNSTSEQSTKQQQQQYQRLVILISLRSVIQAMSVVRRLQAVQKGGAMLQCPSPESLGWMDELLDALVSLTTTTPSLSSKINKLANKSSDVDISVESSINAAVSAVALATKADLLAVSVDIAKCGVVQPLLHGFKTLSTLLGNFRADTQTWAVVQTCHLVQAAGKMEANFVTPQVRDAVASTLASALAVASCRNAASPLLQFVLLNVERYVGLAI